MFTNNNDSQKNKSNTMMKWLLLAFTSLLPLTQGIANELNNKQYSVSHGVAKIELNDQQRKAIIEKIRHTDVSDQRSGKATAKTRAEVLKSRSSKAEAKTSQNNLITPSYSHLNSSQDYSADFAIYGATSLLQDDYDGNGFYQTLSVTFDADIYSYTENQFGEVYALLYISKNGGPWTHYFTTDSFIIEGDTDLDEYEVITTLLSGYPSDYYDVLIDLYQVDYNDIVANYSSDDSNALYALPLESADYDEPYVESYIEVVEISGGSIYWLLLLILGAYLFPIKTR